MNIKGLHHSFGDSGLTTLISVPDRGPFGRSSYRGNYAGEVLAKLLRYVQATGVKQPYVFDPMEGGKTSRDVCQFLQLPYVGDDIHNGFDVVNDSWHDTGFDFVMLHYPYHDMIDYAANLPVDLQQKDMSRMDWKTFMEAVNHVNLKAAAHSRYVAVLVGDCVVKGKGYIKSIQREMVWPGQPIRHLIKVQHNAMSYERKYTSNKFIPVVTEHLLLFKTDYKPGMELWVIASAQYKKENVEPLLSWQTAVLHVMKEQKIVDTQFIYQRVKERFPVKLRNTNTPEATIRRTLQELVAKGKAKRISLGHYECVA